MKYTLRPYQQEMVDVGVANLRRYNKPFIIQAATGAGKSLVIAGICHELDEPVLVLQPSKELLLQNYEKMVSYGIDDVVLHSASVGRREMGKYVMATIGSIKRHPELFKHFKYAIIDECHNVDPKNLEGMYNKFFKATEIRNICGLTATPYRLVQKYVTDEYDQLWYTTTLKMINRITGSPFFKKIAYKIETQELIDMGYLSPIEYFSTGFDFDELEINSTGADFKAASVEKYWNDERIKKIAQAIQYAEVNHVCSLTFCSSIRQAEQTKKLLAAMGVEAELVTGETPGKTRGQTVDNYRAGKLKHILNVGVFTTGFDVPELDCIILARPTMSLALYYQMVGRGVRLDPKRPNKFLTVYDLAGVSSRLGRVETIRVRKEEGGFREEVWTERGRVDETALFEFFVKKMPTHLHK